MKRDRKAGDVRGILETIRPLGGDAARARDGLHGPLVLMAVLTGSLLELTVLIVLSALMVRLPIFFPGTRNLGRPDAAPVRVSRQRA
jgi:hypothetical protein